MTPRHVIFLDIDGVLAHFGSNERLDPECIKELNWLIEHTGAEVILTSSWRDSFGIEETQKRLTAAGLQARIAGAVPRLPHGSRSDEIDAFLAGLKEPVPFAILDDVPVAEHLTPFTILIDDFIGLTGNDVAAAARILQCRRRSL